MISRIDKKISNAPDIKIPFFRHDLGEPEVRAFESLLGESEELQREVAEFKEVGALLGNGAPAAAPNPSLRQRLLDSVKIDSETAHTHQPRRESNWMFGLAWAAAAAGIIVAVVENNRANDLVNQLGARDLDVEILAAELDRQRSLIQDMTGPNTVTFVLTSTREQPPSIILYWDRADNNVVLRASSLDPAPTGREYQLWFLAGGAPIPSVTFNSNPDGTTLVTVPGPSGGVEIQGAAITVEPIGGSPQPTTPIILLGDEALQ